VTGEALGSARREGPRRSGCRGTVKRGRYCGEKTRFVGAAGKGATNAGLLLGAICPGRSQPCQYATIARAEEHIAGTRSFVAFKGRAALRLHTTAVMLHLLVCAI
jgi:hypothetical protein